MVGHKCTVATLIIVILNGCATTPSGSYDYDPNAKEHLGRIVDWKKPAKPHSDIYTYTINMEDGGVILAESKWPYFKIHQCVKVVTSEMHAPKIANGFACSPTTIDRDVYKVYVTSNTESIPTRAPQSYRKSRSQVPNYAINEVGDWVGECLEEVLTDPQGLALAPITAPIAITFCSAAGATVGTVKGIIADSKEPNPDPIPEEVTKSLNQAITHSVENNDVETKINSYFMKQINQDSGESARVLQVAPIVYLDSQNEAAVKDAELTINILTIGFVGSEGDDPLTSLFIGVNSRLFIEKYKQEVFTKRFYYAGEPKSFSEWKDNDYKNLPHELEYVSIRLQK